MAKRVEGLTERILECAKQEFLEKGFKDASLRDIAKKAGSSKGAIYVRFPDKESLFAALVRSSFDGIKSLLISARQEFLELPDNIKMERMKSFSEDKVSLMIEYIYDNYDAFNLLTTCAAGTEYENFIHELVEIDIEHNYKLFGTMYRDVLTSMRFTPELLHIVSSAFFSGIFEIVVHNMSRKDADHHIKMLCLFFEGGWNTMLKR